MTPVLLIDNDAEYWESLSTYLEMEGFSMTMSDNVDQGIQEAIYGEFDAIVIDFMNSEFQGIEILRKIRSRSSVPVLILSNRSDPIDRIVGLELGAEDYLEKPCNPRELCARIHAIVRRAHWNMLDRQNTMSTDLVRTRDGLVLDLATRTVDIQGQRLDLTSTEFNLLAALVNRCGLVITKNRLSEIVLGKKHARYDRSIDMHISKLRKKLWLAFRGAGKISGDSPCDHIKGRKQGSIKTIRGMGYMYVSEDLENESTATNEPVK